MTATAVIALLATPTSAAASAPTESADSRAQDLAVRVSAPDRCRSARKAVTWYRQRNADWLKLRGVHQRLPGRRAPRSCSDARYLAGVAKTRAFRARTVTERWIAAHVLSDFRVAPGENAWLRAVDEVQKVYPDTRSWLRSCSAAEGGWGRFVVHGGGSYYAGAEDAKGGKEVFGPMQYTSGTFRDHNWNARVDAARRGFIVPRSAGNWFSPLGQALAAGWAKFYDKDYRHWEASWSTGCWP